MAKPKNDGQRQTKSNDDVIISFNGKEHRLEEWAKKEVAAADEDQTLNWRKTFNEQKKLNHDDQGEAAPAIVKYKKKKRKVGRQGLPSGTFFNLFKHFWMPFLAAIIVGLGIGFTILILFSDHKTQTTTLNNAAQKENVSSPDQAKAQGAEQNVQALSLRVQVIQWNVFAKKDAATKGMEDLEKSSQIPAAVVNDGEQYAVFIGIADNSTRRKTLETQLQKKKVTLYGKVWDYTPQKFQSSSNVFQYMKKGKTLFTQLIEASGALAEGETPDQKTVNTISKLLDALSVPKDESLSSTTKKDLETFRVVLNTAYNQIKAGQEGQQALLDGLSLYQKICSDLN
ncbi:hypothetical protein JOD43_003475 [Pullulanibacillus pueri]|uniref:SPOR domain-containing protein n=1 Tax=Pullulanibacillus pueri TaxID=1437324 RepID=A0A8J2ZXV7_9BACL|nr:hypothetical protein [Pullulanibacillus pueri]MBM7683296.1 hypothetical protein [Pullulanibacillus pueri]GGH85859.1 hypothetical protein GCM10007096_32230 [Pullulanibacillus pueri]